MTFKHTKKWYFWAKWISKVAGYIFCVCPALIATIVNFPMMVTENVDSTISIPFVLGIMISLTVVLQFVVKSFKSNTLLSVGIVLAFVTALLYGVYKMEEQTIKGLAIVAGTACVGTFIACVCFRLHYIWDDLYKHCGEVYVK